MWVLSLTDAVGYAAALTTLVTFAQTSMRIMRVCAIAANLLFIGYGTLGSFYPVALLHLVLLPLNVIRLIEQSDAWRRRRERRRDLPLLSPQRRFSD